MTQTQAILDYLQQGKRLTPLEALSLFGCFRLGARVYDLRQQGHNVKSRNIQVGKNKRVAEYWIELRNQDNRV